MHCKRDDRSFGVPAKEMLDDRKSVFLLNWTYVVAFRRLTLRFRLTPPPPPCPEFAFLRWSHFLERSPYI